MPRWMTGQYFKAVLALPCKNRASFKSNYTVTTSVWDHHEQLCNFCNSQGVNYKEIKDNFKTSFGKKKNHHQKTKHQKWTAVMGQNILPLFQESQFNCRCQLHSRCWAQFLRRGKEKKSSPPVPLRQSGFSAASSVPGAEVGEGSRGGGSSRGRGTRRGAEAGGNPTENGGGRKLHRGWRGGSLGKQRTRLWPTPRTPPSATRQAASRRQNLLNNTFFKKAIKREEWGHSSPRTEAGRGSQLPPPAPPGDGGCGARRGVSPHGTPSPPSKHETFRD